MKQIVCKSHPNTIHIDSVSMISYFVIHSVNNSLILHLNDVSKETDGIEKIEICCGKVFHVETYKAIPGKLRRMLMEADGEIIACNTLLEAWEELLRVLKGGKNG